LPGGRPFPYSAPGFGIRLHQAAHAETRDVRLMAPAGGGQAVLRRRLDPGSGPRTINPPPFDQFADDLVGQAQGDTELARQGALRHGSAGFELAQNPPLLYLMTGERRHFVPVTYMRGRARTRSGLLRGRDLFRR
jgi:hypothetical protein